MSSHIEDSALTTIIGSHLFKSLDEEGQRRLFAGATAVSLDAGQVVVREGDPGEALYLVRKGRVQVFTTQEGEQIPLATLGPSAWFGEVALLSGRPRTATVIAVEPCTLLRFPQRQIDEILDAYPKVRKLLETMAVGRAEHTIGKITRPPMR
jgi:CRP-like cAMP-binding protein